VANATPISIRRPEIIVSAKQSQDTAGSAKQGLRAVSVQTVAMVSMALMGITAAAQFIRDMLRPEHRERGRAQSKINFAADSLIESGESSESCASEVRLAPPSSARSKTSVNERATFCPVSATCVPSRRRPTNTESLLLLSQE
jgi:hypothetical protein